MTAKEIRNKIADPDGNFRKWGTFFAPIVVAILSVFYTKPAQDGVEKGNAKLDTVIVKLEVLDTKYTLSTQADFRDHARIESNISEYKTEQRQRDQAQWQTIRELRTIVKP